MNAIARSVAVVQPLPGIGDMIWHLPHIRAIADHVGQPVTLIAKPRSGADQIFSAENTVRDVFWLDRNPDGREGRHDGPAGLPKAIAALRARRFDSIYVMHHSKTIALLAMLAAIPERFGYGYGAQRWFLNRPPFLPDAALKLHPFDQATQWLRAAGIPMAEAEPILPVTPASLETVRARIGMPLVAIGIGSSEEYKQWGARRFAALATCLAAKGAKTMVLVGGNAEASLASEIMALAPAVPITMAIGWSLTDIAALLSLAAYVRWQRYGGHEHGCRGGNPDLLPGGSGAASPSYQSDRLHRSRWRDFKDRRNGPYHGRTGVSGN